MPLVLSRKVGESVVVNPGTAESVTVTVVEIDGGKVRLAFDAGRSVVILRQELVNRPNPAPRDVDGGFADGIPK